MVKYSLYSQLFIYIWMQIKSCYKIEKQKVGRKVIHIQIFQYVSLKKGERVCAFSQKSYSIGWAFFFFPTVHLKYPSTSLTIMQHNITLYAISSCGCTAFDLTNPQLLDIQVTSNFTITNKTTTSVCGHTQHSASVVAPQDESQRWKSWTRRVNMRH